MGHENFPLQKTAVLLGSSCLANSYLAYGGGVTPRPPTIQGRRPAAVAQATLDALQFGAWGYYDCLLNCPSFIGQ